MSGLDGRGTPPPLVLPWVVLAHDNHRLMPAKIGKSVRLITAPAYRAAKAAASLLMRATWQGAPLSEPCEAYGVVYFPDRRKRDCGNYRKLVLDAATGIVYDDDSLVWREIWERGPIDSANPRMVLTVRPLPSE